MQGKRETPKFKTALKMLESNLTNSRHAELQHIQHQKNFFFITNVWLIVCLTIGVSNMIIAKNQISDLVLIITMILLLCLGSFGYIKYKRKFFQCKKIISQRKSTQEPGE